MIVKILISFLIILLNGCLGPIVERDNQEEVPGLQGPPSPTKNSSGNRPGNIRQ